MPRIKTIKELNERVWYRCLKIIYISIFLVVIGWIITEFIYNYEPVSDTQVYERYISDNPLTSITDIPAIYDIIWDCRVHPVGVSNNDPICKEINDIREKTQRKQIIFDIFIFLFFIICTILIFEVIKRSFYHIVLGKIRPPKD